MDAQQGRVHPAVVRCNRGCIVNAMNVSVVVPVYNESTNVESLVRRLRALKDDYVKDIIVVDGGSTDGSFTQLQAQLGKHAACIKSDKGRAKQMNAGAQHATGTWLFFLHADTELTGLHIIEAVNQATMGKWGRFDVRLSGHHPAFRVIERFINWRSRWTGVATGDQCLFVRKNLFDELGGFASIPLMEDVELSKRLKRIAPPICVAKPVTTSSRKWEQDGIIKTVWLMWRLRFAYWLGASPDELVKKYYR